MTMVGRKVGESIRFNTVDGIVELSVCPMNGVQLKIGVDSPQPTKEARPEVQANPVKKAKAA